LCVVSVIAAERLDRAERLDLHVDNERRTVEVEHLVALTP
jgi:hypothetical protein